MESGEHRAASVVIASSCGPSLKRYAPIASVAALTAQPLAALPLYGCCIPLAGEGCVRDYAHRRVSERNRRKAALSAEIT